MPNTPLTIIAITTARPGKEAALGAAQEKLVAETLAMAAFVTSCISRSMMGGSASSSKPGKVKPNGALICRMPPCSVFRRAAWVTISPTSPCTG